MSVTCISFVSYSVLDDGDVVPGFIVCIVQRWCSPRLLRLPLNSYGRLCHFDLEAFASKGLFWYWIPEGRNWWVFEDGLSTGKWQTMRVSGFWTVEIVLEGWLRLFPRRFWLRVESELLCWSKSLGLNWWFFFHLRNFDSTHRLNVDYELLELLLHTFRRWSGMFWVKVELSEFVGGRLYSKTIQCKNDGWLAKSIRVNLRTNLILVIWSSLLPGHASTPKNRNFPNLTVIKTPPMTTSITIEIRFIVNLFQITDHLLSDAICFPPTRVQIESAKWLKLWSISDAHDQITSQARGGESGGRWMSRQSNHQQIIHSMSSVSKIAHRHGPESLNHEMQSESFPFHVIGITQWNESLSMRFKSRCIN